MHCVLEQLVVQQSMASNRMKVRLHVDQNAAMVGGDVAIDRLKLGRAAHRITVAIAGGDVVLVRAIPISRLFAESRQPVVRLGEAGIAIQEVTIAR